MRYPKLVPCRACPKCQGEGVVPLSDELEVTLKEVYRTPGFTAPELLERFPGVTVGAINNRLEDLRLLGFLARERRGRAWVYSPSDHGIWE